MWAPPTSHAALGLKLATSRPTAALLHATPLRVFSEVTCWIRLLCRQHMVSDLAALYAPVLTADELLSLSALHAKVTLVYPKLNPS